MCSTPFGITGWDGAAAVAPQPVGFMCSTPFGITGWDGDQADLRQPGAHRVLNAFRHHRVGRRDVKILDTQLFWCSTPFGITGWDGPSG